MKKKFKRVLALCISLSFMFAGTINVSAVEEKEVKEENATKIGIGIDTAESHAETNLRYTPCPGGGKHMMKGRGSGWAYYGSYPSNDLRLKGQAGQCIKCNIVVITENNLFIYPYLPWGKYAMWSPGYEVGNGVVMYTKVFGEINTTDDPFALGFEYR